MIAVRVKVIAVKVKVIANEPLIANESILLEVSKIRQCQNQTRPGLQSHRHNSRTFVSYLTVLY